MPGSNASTLMCRNGFGTLGRCDVDVSIRVSRPDERSERLTGPLNFRSRRRIRSKSLSPPRKRYAHGAHTNLPIAQRFSVAATANGLSQRVGSGDEPPRRSNYQPLEGDTTVFEAVNDLLGDELPAEFEGINIEAERLESVLGSWQADPQGYDVIGELLKLGLTARQARVVVAVSGHRSSSGGHRRHPVFVGWT